MNNTIKQFTLFSILFAFTFVAVAPVALGQSDSFNSGGSGGDNTIGTAPSTQALEFKKVDAERKRKAADSLSDRALNDAFNASRKVTIQPSPPKAPTPGAVNDLNRKRSATTDSLSKLRDARNAFRLDSSIVRQKTILFHAIDVLVKRGEALKERIEQHPLKGTLEESILSEIDADLALLEVFRSEVEAASTTAELKAIAKRLRDHHRDFTQRKARLLMLVWYFGRIEKQHLARLESHAEKLEDALDRFEAGSLSQETELREALVEAKKILADVRSTILTEKQNLQGSEVSDVKLANLRDVMESVRTDLKKAYDLLKKVAGGMRTSSISN